MSSDQIDLEKYIEENFSDEDKVIKCPMREMFEKIKEEKELNKPILPKEKEPQETTVTIEVDYKNSVKEEKIIFSNSRSKTIDKLKASYPFENEFWYSLNKNNTATTKHISDNGLEFKTTFTLTKDENGTDTSTASI